MTTSQINVAADNTSGAPPGTTCTRSTPLTPAIPTGSMAGVLVSSVSSLPKRKVLAFSSWILCVLRPHLRVSICSHFSRVFCPIRKREHPVSTTPLHNVAWCAVISSEKDKEECFHFFTVPEHLVFPCLDIHAPNVPSRGRCGNGYVRSAL